MDHNPAGDTEQRALGAMKVSDLPRQRQEEQTTARAPALCLEDPLLACSWNGRRAPSATVYERAGFKVRDRRQQSREPSHQSFNDQSLNRVSHEAGGGALAVFLDLLAP